VVIASEPFLVLWRYWFKGNRKDIRPGKHSASTIPGSLPLESFQLA